MRINQVNNLNFNARIKLQKPDKVKLLGDAAILGAGLSSIFTGLDSFNIIPSTVTETMFDSTMCASGDVFADPTVYSYLSSLPLGTANSIYGSLELIMDAYSMKTNNKKMPN